MAYTLTVRADETLHKALRGRAEAQGKSISELVREILAEALSERPLEARIGHLKGKLDLPASDDPWRMQMRERNWRS